MKTRVSDMQELYEKEISLKEELVELEKEEIAEKQRKHQEDIESLQAIGIFRRKEFDNLSAKEKKAAQESAEGVRIISDRSFSRLIEKEKELREARVTEEEKARAAEVEEQRKSLQKQIIGVGAFIKDIEQQELIQIENIGKAHERAYEDELGRIKRKFLESQSRSKEGGIDELKEEKKLQDQRLANLRQLKAEEQSLHDLRMKHYEEVRKESVKNTTDYVLHGIVPGGGLNTQTAKKTTQDLGINYTPRNQQHRQSPTYGVNN